MFIMSQALGRSLTESSLTVKCRVASIGTFLGEDLFVSIVIVRYYIPIPDFYYSAVWPLMPKKHSNGLIN